MFYSEKFKEKVLYTFNDNVLSQIGITKEELQERLECEDPFIGRIIDNARYSNVSTSKTNLDELYAEWENIFYNPQNSEWAQSYPYQNYQEEKKSKQMRLLR